MSCHCRPLTPPRQHCRPPPRCCSRVRSLHCRAQPGPSEDVQPPSPTPVRPPSDRRLPWSPQQPQPRFPGHRHQARPRPRWGPAGHSPHLGCHLPPVRGHHCVRQHLPSSGPAPQTLDLGLESPPSLPQAGGRGTLAPSAQRGGAPGQGSAGPGPGSMCSPGQRPGPPCPPLRRPGRPAEAPQLRRQTRRPPGRRGWRGQGGFRGVPSLKLTKRGGGAPSCHSTGVLSVRCFGEARSPSGTAVHGVQQNGFPVCP